MAAVSLFLCQTVMAAQACALATAGAGESAMSEPCHGTAPRSGSAPDDARPSGCPSGYAAPALAQLDIPPAADFPALPVQLDRIRVPVHYLSAAAPARAEPPPLAILHCCLRN